MEFREILSELNNAAPGKVLETAAFGKSGVPVVWIDSSAVRTVAQALKQRAGFDRLENLSVAEIAGALMLTYFLRTTKQDQQLNQLVLRATLPPPISGAPVWVESVRDTWEMAAFFEKEAMELFGAYFFSGVPGRAVEGGGGKSAHEHFPLRKTRAPS